MSDTETWNWQENQDDKKSRQSQRVIDLSFKLDCQCLHVDHTTALHNAIHDALPWFRDEALTGLHLIYLAGSQNGWMKPENPDELLYLSRRTRLTLRVPIEKIPEAQSLTGQVLDIAGNQMAVGDAIEKQVLANDILLSRHVITHDDDENEFLKTCATQLKLLDIHFKKLLPGKQLNLRGPNGIIKTRSLMVADIDLSDSLTLQEQGLGDGRNFGCGLFIHQKGIKAVSDPEG